MATQRLTIYLLRDIDKFDDALAEDAGKGLDSSKLSQASGLAGRFYSKKSFTRTPGWVKYLDPAVDGGVQGLQSASASGLLILKVDSHTFALTFGYGRSFLNQAKIERRFGLKVVLNLIDERQIRSLDTKKFDEMVVSTNTQTSRTTELPTFGVDILRDIVRAVTGIAPQNSGYKSLSGADALVLGIDKPVTDLPAFLRDLYLHYTATKYQAWFGWVDQLAEVKDPALVSALDDQLVKQLKASEVSSTHMAMPENLEWEDIEHFLIAPTVRQTHFDELDLDAYLGHPATKPGELTVDRLKSRKVSVKFLRSADADARWSVYQCLVSEQRLRGVLYALIEGRWFSIADSLVTQVDTAIAAIPQATVSLPVGLPGESEGDYNARGFHLDRSRTARQGTRRPRWFEDADRVLRPDELRWLPRSCQEEVTILNIEPSLRSGPCVRRGARRRRTPRSGAICNTEGRWDGGRLEVARPGSTELVSSGTRQSHRHLRGHRKLDGNRRGLAAVLQPTHTHADRA